MYAEQGYGWGNRAYGNQHAHPARYSSQSSPYGSQYSQHTSGRQYDNIPATHTYDKHAMEYLDTNNAYSSGRSAETMAFIPPRAPQNVPRAGYYDIDIDAANGLGHLAMPAYGAQAQMMAHNGVYHEGRHASFRIPEHEEIKDPPTVGYASPATHAHGQMAGMPGRAYYSLSPETPSYQLSSLAEPATLARHGVGARTPVPCQWLDCAVPLDDTSPSGIRRHLRAFHSLDTIETCKGERGRCKWADPGVCDRELDLASFGKHIASVHLKSTAAACAYCNCTIGRQDSLRRHMRDHCPQRPTSA